MKCIDEGVLQAYNDGELSTETAGRVAAHLAACETCAASARDAGAEFAAFASAFSVDESLSVPSDRLRSNITAAIAASEAARTSNTQPVRSSDDSIGARLRAFAAAFAASLAPRQAAAFAGLALAALLVGVIFYTLRTKPDAPGNQPNDLAVVKPSPAQSPSTQSTPGGGTPAPQILPSASPSPATIDVAAAGGGSQKKGGVIREAKFTPRGGPRLDRRNAGTKEILLPVEREYQTEIASLKSAIEGPGTLPPSLRAEYARSLAVVDQAIAASRGAARSNPQDADAQEFLRTAYRDKLDLLSAVADRAQLAGLQR